MAWSCINWGHFDLEKRLCQQHCRSRSNCMICCERWRTCATCCDKLHRCLYLMDDEMRLKVESCHQELEKQRQRTWIKSGKPIVQVFFYLNSATAFTVVIQQLLFSFLQDADISVLTIALLRPYLCGYICKVPLFLPPKMYVPTSPSAFATFSTYFRTQAPTFDLQWVLLRKMHRNYITELFRLKYFRLYFPLLFVLTPEKLKQVNTLLPCEFLEQMKTEAKKKFCSKRFNNSFNSLAKPYLAISYCLLIAQQYQRYLDWSRQRSSSRAILELPGFTSHQRQERATTMQLLVAELRTMYQ